MLMQFSHDIETVSFLLIEKVIYEIILVHTDFSGSLGRVSRRAYNFIEIGFDEICIENKAKVIHGS